MLLVVLLLSPTPAPAFSPFVDPLPIPPSIVVPLGQTELTIAMTAFTGKVHRDLPALKQWGYNGSSPGPTIEVERGQSVTVHWVNRLPAAHLLPAPREGYGLPDVRTVVRLHGAPAEQPEITDKLHDNGGWPDLWLTPGEEQLARYENSGSARTLWYHDQASGTAGRNVAAGLFGAYLVHDDLERSLGLPAGRFALPLLLQPRKLKADGSLDYVNTLTKENYGNAFFVNGKLYPYLEVEPRRYRFHLVNASNSRTVALKLLEPNLVTPGPAFHLIGTDAGFLADSVLLNDPADPASPRLELMPAQRADLIVDFSQYAGKTFILNNNSKPDDADGVVPLYQLLQMRVGKTLSEPDASRIPGHIRDVPPADPADAVRTRRLRFVAINRGGTDTLTFNGLPWDAPEAESATLGTTEIWELVNALPDSNPFSLGSARFQLLDRRPFDLAAYGKSGALTFTGPTEPPLPTEGGWKDSVHTWPGTVTRILVSFGPFPGYDLFESGILEHADLDMKRPFRVLAPEGPYSKTWGRNPD